MITMMLVAALQVASATPSVAKPTAVARPQAAAVRQAPPRAHRVVVDAGHGGVDPGSGMRGSGLVHEKDIALQVSLKLGELLAQRGVDVIYTRKTDTLIARADRGRIANQANGDVFISIHVNAANPGWRDASAARGFETWFLGVAKTEDARRVEEMEESSGRFETGTGRGASDPLDFIVNDMLQNEYLRESSDLAATIQRGLKQMHPGPDRGVKQAEFTVLVTAFMPAVLVEIGFGTNPQEAAFLRSQSKQRALAAAVADATMEYLERYQRRVSGGSASTAHE
ncbi:MAG: N-acetylmuramoyl-L-alanine amidase [Gemmatimonadaceae bacterium]